MATAKKPVKTSTSKKPSAAELARREAQSSKDKGDILEITVDGIKATLKQEWFNDYETIAQLNAGNVFLLTQLMWPDLAQQFEALKPLRDEDGKLTTERVTEWLQKVLDQVNAGK